MEAESESDAESKKEEEDLKGKGKGKGKAKKGGEDSARDKRRVCMFQGFNPKPLNLAN